MTLKEAASRLEEVKDELQVVNQELSPLEVKREILRAELRKLESLVFIKSNNIQKADIELSNGEDRPWFKDIYEFAQWLKGHKKKPWCEWNGRIYRTAELTQGEIRIGAAQGVVDDVKD